MRALDRVLEFASGNRVFVPAHPREVDGHLQQVDSYWRKKGNSAKLKPAKNDLGSKPLVKSLGKPLPKSSNYEEVPLFRVSEFASSKDVNFKDQRTAGGPLHLEPKQLDAVMQAVRIKKEPNLKIDLRLHTSSDSLYGMTQKLGEAHYRVSVEVKPMDTYDKDTRLYVLNNSLVHEMRHVRQMQDGTSFQHNLTGAEEHVADPGYGGYGEIEARLFGRIADHTGTKDLGPLKDKYGVDYQGKEVWGLLPGGYAPEATAAEAEAVGQGKSAVDQLTEKLGLKPGSLGKGGGPAHASLKGLTLENFDQLEGEVVGRIQEAAKTANVHVGDGEYNHATLDRLATLKAQLEAMASDYDGPLKNRLTGYLAYIDQILAAVQKKVKTPTKDYGKLP